MTEKTTDDKAVNKIDYCPECQVGIPRFSSATYYTWIGDEIITVSDFPCWFCDICGRREWDTKAILNLKYILSPGNEGVVLSPSRRKKVKEAKSPRTKAQRGARS